VNSVLQDVPKESPPRDAAAPSVPVGGTALVLDYIERRAHAPETDVENRLNDSLNLIHTLQTRLAELQGADERAADLQRTVEALTVQNTRLAEKLSALEGADKRAAELQRTNEALTAQNTQLMDRVRELEIGFRRFASERVSPEQLELALKTDATATPAATTPEAGPSPEPIPSSEANTPSEASPALEPSEPSSSPAPQPAVQTPPSDSDPEPKKPKNRHNHGRRRQFAIPRLILEVVPPEVEREGLANFKRVGQEESSTLGHRRGGCIEVITRRVKFVRVQTSQGSASNPDAPSADTAAANTATDTAAAVANAIDIDTADTDDIHDIDDEVGASTTLPTPSVATPACVMVLQHEVFTVPVDTACKSNPFLDGALVRYTPASTDDGDGGGAVLIADVPERPLARSLVDASLLAHLLVRKFDYHVPFYRQEIEASRQGCPNSRTNMSRWQFEAGSLAMRIADAAWQDALETRLWFGTDATGIAIQAEDKYRYGHVFVLVAPGDGVLYRYAPTYDSATVEKLYGGYTGTIVADASANHNILFGPGKAREGGCWSHARKPFVNAFKAGEGKSAAFAVKTIQGLFRIEKKIALLPPEERLKVRQRDAAPLVDALFEWAERELLLAPNDSLLRKGLVYLHNQRDALREFLRNGEIPIHNNASERAARHVVCGRKNWLSHGSDDHAMRACAITSLIVSCEMHGLDPEFYLQEVLTVAPSWPICRMLDLTPKHWVATRQRLIAEGRLKYIDLAQVTGSRLTYPAR